MFRGKKDKERDYLIERASKTQIGLLPNQIPRVDGYQIHVYFQSAKALSGDYYDFIIDHETKRMEALIMDVSGKDFPAAITVSQLAGAMYILFKDPGMDIAEKLRQLNAMMFDRTRRETFVTAMLMRLDFANHILSFTNAGHNPLIVNGETTFEDKGQPAPAIGFVDDDKFSRAIKAVDIPMGPGMSVVSYTDGITEAMDPKRNEYGKERLMQVVEEYRDRDPALMAQTIHMELLRHERGTEPSDDRTLIAIKRDV
jgi:sigma-B regulation protein RsbU (phosphoserine phosphatase)